MTVTAAPRRRFPAGATNPFSVLLVVGIVVVGWYGYHLVPLYYDNLECGEAVQQGLNVAILEGVDRGKVNALNRMNMKIGWHFAVDEESGLETALPGLGLEPEALEMEVETAAKRMSAHLAYDRVIQLKPFDKRKSYHFSVDKQVKIQ